MTKPGFRYEGSELALFAEAHHWKRHFARSLRPFMGATVLEVGAGIGGTTLALCAGNHRRWLCLEPDDALTGQLQERIRTGGLPAFCEQRVGTLGDLPVSERFDTITYVDVLEHIERDREELERAAEHLNPGGYLAILAPAHQWLFSPLDAAVGHFRRYSRRSLLGLGPSGTKVVRARYLDSVGMLASLANRLILRNALPTPGQIRVWDSYMVPCSRFLDPMFFYNFGKTVIVVWQRS